MMPSPPHLPLQSEMATSHALAPIRCKGWVPTATGRLSFSFIGETSFPTRAVGGNVANEWMRYIIVYQKRPTSDALFPWIACKLKRKSKEGAEEVAQREQHLWFLCIARCHKKSGRRALIGRVLVFGGPQSWRWVTEDRVRQALGALNGLDNQPKSDLNARIRSDYKRLMWRATEEADFHVDFSLERHGEATFRVGAEALKHFEDGDAGNADAVNAVVSQAFFFLKDLVHRHQHHHPSTDTLTDVYPLDRKNPDLWRRRTDYSLMRIIIGSKRQPHDDSLGSALGILAYLRSFKAILENKPDGVENGPRKYNLESLEASIRAKQDSQRHRKQWQATTTLIYQAVAVLFLTISSVLFYIVGLTDYKVAKSGLHHFLIWLSDWVAADPLPLVGGSLLLVFATPLLLGWTEPPKALLRAARILVKLAQSYKQKWAATLITAAGFGILAISFSLAMVVKP